MAEYPEPFEKLFRRFRGEIEIVKEVLEGLAFLLSHGKLLTVAGLIMENQYVSSLSLICGGGSALGSWLFERVKELDGQYNLERSESSFNFQGPGEGFYLVGPDGTRTAFVLSPRGVCLTSDVAEAHS